MSQPIRISHLSEEDLARLRRKLEDMRNALLVIEQAAWREQQEADHPDTGDFADLAERTIEQEETLREATFATRLLGEIEHALAKLAAGTYGISEQSGEPIDLARLEVVPWARRTAEEEERYQHLHRGEARP